MSFQKCQKCDRPATHKITRIIDGQAVDFYLCQEHAAEFSPLQGQSALAQKNLAQLLAGLLKSEQGQKAEKQAAADADLKCRRCGTTLREYRRTMLLGCSECYRTFEKHLTHDLRRYHGTIRHCGKHPLPKAGEASGKEMLEALRKRLQLAIADEDFELAAQLRDQIRQLSAAGDKSQAPKSD